MLRSCYAKRGNVPAGAEQFYTRAEAYRAWANAGRRDGESEADWKLALKQARWQTRGAHYLRGRSSRFRAGAVMTLDTDMGRLSHELVAAAAPAYTRTIEAHLVPLAVRALDNWPVDSGLSRSLMRMRFEQVGDTFITILSNEAPYAWYINRSNTVKGLIFKPADIVAQRMAEMFAREVTA